MMFRSTLIAVALAATGLVTPLAAQTKPQPSSTPATPATQPAAQSPSATSVARPAPATVAQPPSTTSAAGVDVTTTIALLDRIQKMLDDATDGKPGEVKIERGLVDEMRAELTQARLALKGSK